MDTPLSRGPQCFRVLVIDDDPNIVSSLCRALSDAFITVTGVTSADEALRVIPSNPPDLIISDYRMPHMNGVELFRRLRADHRFANIPFVLHTADAEAVSGLCIDVAVLAKPCETKTLRGMVLALARR